MFIFQLSNALIFLVHCDKVRFFKNTFVFTGEEKQRAQEINPNKTILKKVLWEVAK